MSLGRVDIEAAATRIEGRVRRTPVMELDLEGVSVVVKLELFQHTGSFKPRGAFNRILAAESIPPTGVIAASGGNHGLAVAYVARELGVPAEIYITEVTPEVKRSGIAELGARVVIGGEHYPDAQETARVRAAETGALNVHAFDHPLTVAGQGTMARELEDQVPDLDTVVMAVGGGGFIAGAAVWFGSRKRVVGVEPEGAPTLYRALEAGEIVEVKIDSIAADSLGSRRIGSVPFSVIPGAVSEVVLVTDQAIRFAQRWFWERLRLVVEPGGAAAAAAVLDGGYRPAEGERVVVVVCGANTDPAALMG